MGFLFLILYPGLRRLLLLLLLLLLLPPSSTLATHTLSTHTLSPNTLSTHTLSTHTLSPHTLSTHTLSTHTLSTHTLSPHTLSPHTLHHTLCHHHFLTTHFLTTHFTLSPHTFSPHTFSTHFLTTHFLTTHFLTTHFVTTTFSTHTLSPHTLSPHTLSPHTFSAWHKLSSAFVLRGRRGTHGTRWRAWAGLVRCDAVDAAVFHVAGVAQSRRFAWQACDRWHWVARLDRLGRGTLRGRRATDGTGWRAWTGLGACDAAALCVAGVRQMALGGALGPAWAPVTPRHFAWQAWHNLTSTFISRGRRGTKSHPPSFCVAGVGQMALGGALGPAWAPVTPRHFAWQAWHNLTSTFISRGRRGTMHPPSFCVAGVGQMALGGALGPAWAPVTPRHFAWQAWHNLTSTFVSRGRRGTKSHPPSFCVAGVRQMALGGALGPAWAPVTPRHFAWQAWHNLTSTFISRGRRGTKSHPPSL